VPGGGWIEAKILSGLEWRPPASAGRQALITWLRNQGARSTKDLR
jgi:hypothetical protein